MNCAVNQGNLSKTRLHRMLSGQIDVLERGVGERGLRYIPSLRISRLLENPHAAMINAAAQSAHEASTSSLKRNAVNAFDTPADRRSARRKMGQMPDAQAERAGQP
jgi:hypothetical protein